MISAWLLGIMRDLKDQNKYMKSILWAYANNKIEGGEEARKAIKIIERWGENDGDNS